MRKPLDHMKGTIKEKIGWVTDDHGVERARESESRLRATTWPASSVAQSTTYLTGKE